MRLSSIVCVYVTVAALSVASCAESVVSEFGQMPTQGGADITIMGRHLGLSVTFVTVRYGTREPLYTMRDCVVVVVSQSVRCRSAPGTGRDLPVFVVVDGMASAPANDTLAYQPPYAAAVVCSAHVLFLGCDVGTCFPCCVFSTISGIDGDGFHADTVAGVSVQIRGTNLGPRGGG